MDRTCMDCGVSIAHRGNAAKRCEICGEVANNPRAGTERPCKNPSCTEMVKRSGNVYPNFCSDDCKPRCSVDQCEDPQRKKGWCASHYSQWQRTGEARPFRYKWTLLESCLACGGPMPTDIKSGQFCSGACRVHWRNHDGDPPRFAFCEQCGDGIDLRQSQFGRRRRCDVITCEECQRRYDPRKVMSARQLCERDGCLCAICGDLVDLDLRFPDLMCGTVDHILPRSRGGGDEGENLQLAHLICNLRKGNKTPEEMVAV